MLCMTPIVFSLHKIENEVYKAAVTKEWGFAFEYKFYVENVLSDGICKLVVDIIEN
jgi:hypothetical protein